MQEEMSNEDYLRWLEERIEKLKKKIEEYYGKIRLYEAVVDRYREYIEENEAQTIQDLKKRVSPDSEKLKELLDEISSSIPSYDPERDLEKACSLLYDSISERIMSVPSIDVNFWMDKDEMLEKGFADYEDKAILLCSAFRGLGADARVLICSMEDGSDRPLVLLALPSKYVLLDPNRKHDFHQYTGARQEILSRYEHEGKKISKVVYEFNDIEYKED
ncbi:hypothetical protein DRN74_01170 [Candidatus Micrarchaeota archaeon]|nr:MAG: hypothetical protein DRN74_01170 [Candidatus Micrarchaeota archaeon]